MPLFYTKGGFLEAVKDGDIDLVRQYLQKDKSYANVSTKDGETALYFAVIDYRTNIVSLLLDAGAKNDGWCNPLGTAIRMGSLEMVRLFINHGWAKDINFSDAVNSNKADVIKEVLATGKIDLSKVNPPPLYTAARYGRLESLKTLLELGLDPNVCHTDDETSTPPLYAAVEGNHTNIVGELLKAGANPNLPQDDDGVIYFPLHKAVENDSSEIIAALLKAGADINIRNSKEETPLHIATRYGRGSALKLLLEHKASIDLCDNEGKTPLRLAIDNRRSDLVELLLEYGARPDIADKAGITPTNAPYVTWLSSGTQQKLATADKAIAEKKARDALVPSWKRQGENEIAYIRPYPDLGYSLTYLFNFETRERVTVSEDLGTKARSHTPPEKFEDLTDESLTSAFEEFKNQGGKADEEHVFKFRQRRMRK